MRKLAIVLAVAGCSSTTVQPPGGGDDDAVPDAGDVVTPPGVWSADPACSAAPGDIYTAVAAGGARGSIASCALGDKLDTAQTQSAMAGDGAEGGMAQPGVRVVKLAYRTVRSDGSPAITTATAYVPLVPRAVPAPIVLIGRSTSGLADSCAPSKDAMPGKNL